MNILITGASRGIGFETAKKFASMGENNIIAISRNEQGLKDLKNACIRENVAAHLFPIQFDLFKVQNMGEELVPHVKKYIQHIDILINNAGYLVNKPFVDLSDMDISQMVSVNFSAPAKLINVFLPLMGPNGHVINISSMGGFQGSSKFPGLSVYSATKSALANLTECLAEELKHTGVSFNCLALGAVNTEMLAEAFPDYKAQVSAHDMASFIADFSINGHRYFNGKVLPVSISTP